MQDHVYRRVLGLLLGAGLGLSFGLVSQFINSIVLPGIAFYQPPCGAAGNAGLCAMAGAALGLLCAWPSEAATGVLAGSALGALAMAASAFLPGESDAAVLSGKAMILLLACLPMVAAMVPLLVIHRWAVNRDVEARRTDSIGKRLLVPLALLLAVGGLGLFYLYPPYTRIMVSKTQSMLQAGLQASDESLLPPPLQSEAVGGFLAHAQPAYSLEWNNTQVNRFAIPRPMTDRPWEEAVVIARFENGWRLVCLFADAGAEPRCKGLASYE